MKLFNLTGKVAIVTGASRGIGRSIAFQLARAGAKVVVSSRKLDACEAVVKEIQAEGGTAMAISASIAVKDQLQALIQKTKETWGPIDILVCNAASNPYYGPATGMSDEVFNKVMHNNVLSSTWLCNMVYPDMKARKDGAIVLVSSVGGLHGSAVIGAYNISKAADMQLARNLAVEWGPDNIRVNCIAPGLIRTDFAKALTDDPVKAGMVENETPLRRIGEPDDIGGIAVLLASAAGKYITGQTIVADGQTLWLHDVELNQVTARKQSQVLGSTPAALLTAASDLQALKSDFQFTSEPERDGLHWVRATPQSPDGQIRSVMVGLRSAAAGPELAVLDVQDSLGQRSVLTFTGFEVNPALPAASFVFKAPVGADVIKP